MTKRKLFLLISLGLLVAGIAGAARAQSTLSMVTPPDGLCNGKWGMYTAQMYQTGYVTISTDCENLTLSFVTWDWLTPQPTFGHICVWIGNDLSYLPMTNGMPDAGKFTQTANGKCIDATGMTAYTWTIPVSALTMVDVSNLYNTDIYIVTVAEVDTDGDPLTPFELAYAGSYGQNGTGGYWNYGIFQMCCSVPSCNETAFAKGNWVWTKQPKSNPDGLPSLMLTQNRWGWAINLLPGMTAPMTYQIYAGAGLNNTSKGVLVGTLDVQWTGTNVTLKYNMLPGYMVEEVHIYAGDTPPMTIAPGQYGYVDSFAPVGTSSVGPVSFAVSDSNGDGIWLIAHAVVKMPCEGKRK
jgi:hypothetical protein